MTKVAPGVSDVTPAYRNDTLQEVTCCGLIETDTVIRVISIERGGVHHATETKSIFSVVREDDSVFAHKTLTYDGKDELN
jgi:hypothetical protein